MVKHQIRKLAKFIFSPVFVFCAGVILFSIAATFLPYVLLFLLLYFDGPSHDEVARVASPDRALDAILIETNGGATTSFGYEIYIMPHGKKAKGSRVASLYGAGRNLHAYGANLKWESSTQVAVEYQDAKGQKLEIPEALVSGKKITVLLRSGVTDSSAPPGGMLYNLEKSGKK